MSGEVKKLKSCGCEADDHPDCISYPSATLGSNRTQQWYMGTHISNYS